MIKNQIQYPLQHHALPSNFEKMSTKMVEICRVLTDKTDINSVGYTKRWSPYKISHLTTSIDWAKHFYDKKYYKKAVGWAIPMASKNQGSYVQGYNGYSGSNNMLEDSRENFNMDNQFSITNELGERFTFSAKTGCHNIHVLYKENYNLLNKFINYFKNEGKNLLGLSYENPVIFNNGNNGNNGNHSDIIILQPPKNIENNLHLPTDHLYLIYNKKEMVLNKKEVNTAALILKGLNARQISEQLHISEKTVYYRSQSLQRKFNVKTKKQLEQSLLQFKDQLKLL